MVGFPRKQIPRQGLSYLLGKWSPKTPRGSGEVRQERESSQSRSVTRKLVIRGSGGAVPWGHGRALWSTHLRTIPQPEAARLLYLPPPSPSVIGCLLGTSTARPVQTEVRKGGQSTESTYHLPRRCIWGSFVEVLGACGDPQIAVKYSTKNPHLYCGERGVYTLHLNILPQSFHLSYGKATPSLRSSRGCHECNGVTASPASPKLLQRLLLSLKIITRIPHVLHKALYSLALFPSTFPPPHCSRLPPHSSCDG